jgi:hypothetical protein
MKNLFAAVVSTLLLTSIAFSQSTSTISKVEMSQAEIDRIVKAFSANEGQFRDALASTYAFDRSATVSTIGMGGQITGVYRRDSFMTFAQDGRRFERIVYAPVSTLTEISMTPEDLEDLGGVNPFALEPRNIPLYNFTFLGKEKIDELDLYAFEVEPKVMPDPKKGTRLFTGRVWVDDRDLMIVKTKGKGVPETKKNKFPIVETWRDSIDGKYYFPVLSLADDEIVFDSGQVVRLKMRVKYENYRVGRSDVRVIGEEDVPNEPEPSPTPKP